MVIKRAEFMTSLAAADPVLLGGESQIVVVGKSNVGKSSLINALARNQKLARTSSEPGKTRLINLFRFYAQDEREFVLVDLPGYGFARVSREEKVRWQGMIEGYLSQQDGPCHAFSLVDIRHEPSADDRAMVDYMRHYGIEFTVVATKADKLSRAQINRSIQSICRALQVQPWEVIPTSSQSRQGIDKLVDRIGEVLDEAKARNAMDASIENEQIDIEEAGDFGAQDAPEQDAE